MRSAIPLAGVLLVAGVAAVLVRGQPAGLTDAGKSARTITATGTGTADGKPDTVRVHLGVSTFAKTVADARTANKAAVQKVRAAVTGLNLADPKIRTTDTQMSVRTTNDGVSVLGYQVVQSFTVRVSDTDPEKLAALAERILDAGLGNGANTQGRVEFFLADDTALRRKAMQKAVEDAVAAATAYAAGAKVTVAEVTSIDDTPHAHSWFGGIAAGVSNNSTYGGGAAEGGTLSAGNWTASSSVKVVCRY